MLPTGSEFCGLVPMADVVALLGPRLGQETDVPSPHTPGLTTGTGCFLFDVAKAKTYMVARFRYRTAALALDRYGGTDALPGGTTWTVLRLPPHLAPHERAEVVQVANDRQYSAHLLDGRDELVITADGPAADAAFARRTASFLSGVAAAGAKWH